MAKVDTLYNGHFAPPSLFRLAKSPVLLGLRLLPRAVQQLKLPGGGGGGEGFLYGKMVGVLVVSFRV